jgi:acyl-ACP thioesterase
MRHRYRTPITYGAIDTVYRLKLSALLAMFQEAAIGHSRAAGLDPRDLQKAGGAWVLNRVGIHFRRRPRYGETVEIVTWSSGIEGLRAFREFEVRVAAERVVTGSSVWLYLDLATRRLRSIPTAFAAAYTIERHRSYPAQLDQWQPQGRFEPERTVEITTRASDYDPNGHVNNIVYMDYLATLIPEAGRPSTPLKEVRMQYIREIDGQTRSIRVGGRRTGRGVLFKIFSSRHLNALGEFELQPDSGRPGSRPPLHNERNSDR